MPRLPRRRAFTLLEVLVSLAILSVVLTMILRSFTTSLRAAQLEERITVATMLARSLIEEFEILPPPEGHSDGEFGRAFPGYSYAVQHDNRVIDYPGVPAFQEIGRMVMLRRIAVDIFWSPPGDKTPRPRRVIRVESAISGSERYTMDARKKNNLFVF